MLGAVTNASCWLLAALVSVNAGGACARRPLPGRGDDDRYTGAGGAPFASIAPCPTDADYVTGTNTVTFGFLGSPPGFVYDPKCLAVAAGTTVAFMGSFVAHPLYPSATRGSREGNPIGGTSTGESKAFVFPRRGFFAYYCGVHGAADDGAAMAGVIWVR
jgi:plastocyanin